LPPLDEPPPNALDPAKYLPIDKRGAAAERVDGVRRDAPEFTLADVPLFIRIDPARAALTAEPDVLAAVFERTDDVPVNVPAPPNERTEDAANDGVIIDAHTIPTKDADKMLNFVFMLCSLYSHILYHIFDRSKSPFFIFS
jgi:hypothetical protein